MSPDPMTVKRRLQVGIRTVVLAVAATALWMGVFVNRREIRRLESRIDALKPLARELIVADRSRLAVVKMEEMWFDENHWELYLPTPYRLCLATRGIESNGLTEAVKHAPIPSGNHRLALEQVRDGDGWLVTVTCDGKALLSLREPKEWDPGSGSTGGGEYSQCTQIATNQPAVLFRRRFNREVTKGQFSTPLGPAEGILMWLEQAGGSKR